jgi:2-polyprenyl-3-methyl-5-hydroxy-6-metoxy-1,4-benzoquinol methylase
VELKPNPTYSDPVLERELEYYESLYGGFGAGHFAKPAVVAFREYLVARILRSTGAGPESNVLSVGCGVGDTEVMLARQVGHVTGVDLSPTAIREANRAATTAGLTNVRFLRESWQNVALESETYDLVLAIFFLHHLPEATLAEFARGVLPRLRPGGRFYALEPNARRLSGFLGKLLVPNLMKKYQTEDERQLLPRLTVAPFIEVGLETSAHWFDFCSTPLAGLFPSWATGYRVARRLDAALTACPGLRAFSSNFELIAYRPPRGSEDGGTTPFRRI